MKYFAHILCIITISLAVFSCDNSENANSDILTTQPEIPPNRTLQPDFTPIISSGSREKLNTANTEAVGQNFIEAKQRGAVIGSFLGLNVAFPAALVGAASSTTPEMTSPGVWEWNFMRKNPLTNGNVESNLIATIDADNGSVAWQLLLDATGAVVEFQDFEILTGSSTLDGTSGQWDINAFTPETGNENLATTNTWSIDVDSLLTLNSTIELDFSPLKDDEFSFTQQDTLNTLTFTDSSEGETTEITWKMATTAGQLVAPNFNNGEPACWDANKEDVDCSEVGL